jgi:hypothetical protein
VAIQRGLGLLSQWRSGFGASNSRHFVATWPALIHSSDLRPLTHRKRADLSRFLIGGLLVSLFVLIGDLIRQRVRRDIRSGAVRSIGIH